MTLSQHSNISHLRFRIKLQIHPAELQFSIKAAKQVLAIIQELQKVRKAISSTGGRKNPTPLRISCYPSRNQPVDDVTPPVIITTQC